MTNDAMKGDTPAPAPAVKPTPTDCEWCVGGMQADGETPCPCQEPATPLDDSRVKALVEAANGVVNEYYNQVHGPVIYNIKHLDAALSALEENK